MTHRVHGMDGGLSEPVWKPLTTTEVAQVLSQYDVDSERVFILWRSPRPMSSASVVVAGTQHLFVKRHSREVRTTEHLCLEHRFAGWLRDHGIPVPSVLATSSGSTVVASSQALYEVHEVAPGEDRYRDTMSWRPFRRAEDAEAAGRALAKFHVAAEGFDADPLPLGVLTDSSALVTAPDPLTAIYEHIGSRPVLARYLRERNWKRDLAEALGPALDRGLEADIAGAEPLWTHGDWHPSNLSWDRTGVAAVFDLGLTNRTFAMHDLAVAIERSCVDWLRPTQEVDEPALRRLLHGYRAVRPWSDEDRRHLFSCLRVCHVEFALSEVEYFAGPALSPADAELAYGGYLCAHAAGEAWDAVERIGQNMP